MRIRKKPASGFTMIELAISSVVIGLIALVLMLAFRSNLHIWRWGQEHMDFQQKVQLVMKQIFTDIKRINPLIALDMTGDIWFEGERGGDLLPHLVTIYDIDGDPLNGGEMIEFYHTSFTEPNDRTRVRLLLDGDALIREVKDHTDTLRRMVISTQASNLFFKPNPNDIHEVLVNITITDDDSPKLKKELDFAVRLDTDLVYVRMLAGKPDDS